MSKKEKKKEEKSMNKFEKCIISVKTTVKSQSNSYEKKKANSILFAFRNSNISLYHSSLDKEENSHQSKRLCGSEGKGTESALQNCIVINQMEN